ncbi:MAG: hypothetical protein IIY22_08070 [Erysipelotrichaceae bacterium]|nr:hypothetical protein [Erysipelotrichaceae bacterium]
MRYYFKENLHFLYADGQLCDENGQTVYSYENQTLFLPRIDLYKFGTKIGHVKKQFTFFLRQYDLIYGGEEVASLNQEFTFFRPELSVDGLGWKVKGDFFALHYSIYNEEDELIASVDQEIFHLTPHYYIDIFDEYNEELIVLLIIAINQFDKDEAAAANSSAGHSSSNR